MKYKIARAAIIGMICICLVHYLFSHYDGEKYSIETVEDYVRKVCEIGNVPGMSVVVLDGGQEYYMNAGYADKDEKTAMTSKIRCELGSTTKAFTALGILLLEQDNKLDRMDSVKDYLPWFHPTYGGDGADITIEHLLCHTSGIPVWTIADLPVGSASDAELLENTVKGIQSVKLESMPGTVHSYFRVDDSKPEQSAQGYRYAFLGAGKYDAPAFYGNTAAGYLVSDTEDLSIWMKAQMGIYEMDMSDMIKRIDDAMKVSHSYPIEKGQHYFAGWNLYDTYFCHGGNNPNFSSQVIIGRTNKKAVFALVKRTKEVCGHQDIF